MRVSGSSSGPVWISPLGLAIATVFCVTSAVWWVLWTIAPQAALDSSLASQILFADLSQLHPEPQEQFVYLGLVVAAPIVVVAVGKNFSRRAHFGAGVLDWLLLLSSFGLAAFVLRRDPSAAFASPRAIVVLLSVAVGFALACWEGRMDDTTCLVIRCCLFVVASIAGVMLIFSWKVFDGAAVAEAGMAPHLGAFLYSISQIFYGGVCTVDVQSQYGCYGEFYLPLLRATGLSVLNVSLINAVLQSAGIVAILSVCFRLIRSPLLLLACALCVIALVGGMPLWADVYFQYGPLRLFFPAVSLPLAFWWCCRSRASSTLVLGGYAALAIFANPDSGFVVFGALGLLVALGHHVRISQAVKFSAVYVASAAAVMLALLGLLSLRAGRTADFSLLLEYIRIFAGAGFLMLPMPAPPSSWTVAVGVALVALTIAALNRFKGRDCVGDTLAAYIAVLGIGLMGYYVGRSHPLVLLLCVWPLVILLFILLDRAQTKSGRFPAKLLDVTCRAVAAPTTLIVVVACLNAWPLLVRAASANWRPILFGDDRSPGSLDIEFIEHSINGESFEVLSANQAVIHTETATHSRLPGPGLDEILLKTDAEKVIRFLQRNGPDHLFISKDLLQMQPARLNTRPWILEALPRLRKAYSLKEFGPGQRLLHFVRKPTTSPDLLDESICDSAERCAKATTYLLRDPKTGEMVDRLALRSNLPIDMVMNVAERFRVVLKVVLAAEQIPYGTLISTHCCYQGFVVHRLPRSPGWALAVGDSKQWVTSDPFDIPASQPTKIVISYSSARVSVMVNGTQVATLESRPTHPFAASRLPLTIGDWYNRNRPLAGTIDEVLYFDESGDIDGNMTNVNGK